MWHFHSVSYENLYFWDITPCILIIATKPSPPSSRSKSSQTRKHNEAGSRYAYFFKVNMEAIYFSETSDDLTGPHRVISQNTELFTMSALSPLQKMCRESHYILRRRDIAMHVVQYWVGLNGRHALGHAGWCVHGIIHSLRKLWGNSRPEPLPTTQLTPLRFNHPFTLFNAV